MGAAHFSFKFNLTFEKKGNPFKMFLATVRLAVEEAHAFSMIPKSIIWPGNNLRPIQLPDHESHSLGYRTHLVPADFQNLYSGILDFLEIN